MAGTGMALRRGTNHGPEAGDDVQSSIELLDRVLSEFDDLENANQVQNWQFHNQIQQINTTQPTNASSNGGNVSSTPEDESPSLGGHQSEDDGYMSMNGRKAKFALSFKPVTEASVHQENSTDEPNDFPPPPEEAERLISTLLPRVSPANSAKRNSGRRIRAQNQQTDISSTGPRNSEDINHIMNCQFSPMHTATQTTLPKTRHQRPFGWENQEPTKQFRLHPVPGYRYASLPSTHPLTSPTRVPPRTVPTAIERHREVRRCIESEDNLSTSDTEAENTALRPLSELADDERFSDDSLEEMLPPPPQTCNKRGSIAWEVPLDEDPLLTPGSTKVVGRRRRRSGENSHSSTSSIPNRLKDLDQDWPDPPPCSTEDEVVSPFSDSDQDQVVLPEELNRTELNGSNTYIVRRGKKDRKPIASVPTSGSVSSLNSRLSSDLSIPHSRFSGDLSTRLSRDLQHSSSRNSVDLDHVSRHIYQELNSPKSRFSLDLNSSKHVDTSPSNRMNPRTIIEFQNKHSTTFDNIKSLIKEGVINNCDGNTESVQEFMNPNSPIVRVVSLPTLSDEYSTPRRELAVTVEEEEDVESPRQNSAQISPLRKIEQNISELLERRDIDENSLLNINNQNHIQRSEDYYRKLLQENSKDYNHQQRIQKSESAKEMKLSHLANEKTQMINSCSADFPVKVEIIQHDFPPLPPSPVEEDDEYSEILQPLQIKTRADTLPVMSTEQYQSHKDPPAVPPHRDPAIVSNSLKTRSMDGGIGRGRRNNFLNNSHRMASSQERRTLPTDLPGTKRRTFQKRTPDGNDHPHMQTSCSLPETPIFARGCDIPRTPHRRAPDVPERGLGGHRTTPRQTPSPTVATLGHLSTSGSTYGRRGLSNSNLEQALVGAELLRLAGGPGRGWYPRHRHPRPASIEHLDRLTPNHGRWDSTSRKPLTLPPNLTPKFFQRSPREALRRVTSLLIRKGNTTKETKKDKEPLPQTNSSNGEDGQKKKGFFKNFWKRSRHYSLEQQ